MRLGCGVEGTGRQYLAAIVYEGFQACTPSVVFSGVGILLREDCIGSLRPIVEPCGGNLLGVRRTTSGVQPLSID